MAVVNTLAKEDVWVVLAHVLADAKKHVHIIVHIHVLVLVFRVVPDVVAFAEILA